MKRVFVTGANGFIGKVLCRALAGRHQLFGIDRSGEAAVPGIFRGDIADRAALLELIDRCMPLDAVVHLAADARLAATWDSVFHNNVTGTFNVFDTCRELGIPKVFFASTLHVTLASDGGELVATPGRFDSARHLAARQAPDCAYAASKVFGEAMASALAARNELSVTCMRLGWVKRDMRERAPPGAQWLDDIILDADDLVARIERWLDEPPGSDTRIALSESRSRDSA